LEEKKGGGGNLAVPPLNDDASCSSSLGTLKSQLSTLLRGPPILWAPSQPHAGSPAMRNANHHDEDDMFKDSRMSFGDHIEELRTHLWRAIMGLVFCMFIGFVLDQIGDALNRPWIGIGKPAMAIIKAPVDKALNEFYEKRLKRLQEKSKGKDDDPDNPIAPHELSVRIPKEQLATIRGVDPGQVQNDLDVKLTVNPEEIYRMNNRIQKEVRPPELSTLTAMEAFMVYFKVTLVCGLVIASPWVFWQIWSFIAKGLYPHEKKYVHMYLPMSLGLFLAGVVLCEVVVMPRTVSALLWFNDFLGFTPELRLNDWLSLAIMLPLVFGVSFQTPLIMLFLERIGIMDMAGYKSKRKYAVFALAVFAMIITPTPDALTMCALWIPMCLLYELGIWMCYFMPGRHVPVPEGEAPTLDELIEV
jgi:sec-independent protein translocase protein TatC